MKEGRFDRSEVVLMRGFMPEVPQFILDWRTQTGADLFDEMWEGVLHMVPAPNVGHQDFEWELETWLRLHWARPRKGKVYHDVNVASVGGWPKNYRIPDLVLLTPQSLHIDRHEYLEGPPDVVVEIRSPGDETIEKMPFYAGLGVPEVWIIDRDTKVPELHILKEGSYERQSPAKDGWLWSQVTGIRFRGEASEKLAIEIAGDPSTQRVLPED